MRPTPGCAGITASFQLVEKSDSNGNGPFQNQVNVTSTTVDPGPSPNFANTSTPVRQDADLQVSKVGPLTATAGQPTITYTITAANNGPSDAVNVSLNDALPATLTFQASNDAGAPVAIPPQSVPLPSNSRVTVNINQYLAGLTPATALPWSPPSRATT